MKNADISSPNTADTLLIIDDVEMNRAILAEIFRDSYRIEEAENGREALAILADHAERICAVLLDVIMPELDGIGLLRIMKEMNLLEHMPVFLVTAETGDEVTREAYALGVMDVIGKPVVPHIVTRRVNSIIELFQARKRLGNVVERQREELFEQTKKMYRMSVGMVESLSTAIEFRSDESGEHVRRIHDITDFLLRNTRFGDGLSENEIELIALAAIMHDVGKIAIPDAILKKPGRFTPEEFEIMKAHTIQGGRLLAKIPQMKEHESYSYAYDIALHHHERWDGRGYPDGLKGDEISVWSQVVSLADVYDALISKRCYKDACSCDEAVRMIVNGECGVFNPELIDSFLQVEGELRRMYQEKINQNV